MDSQNMSQQDFAKMLDISPGSLCGILNERTRPTNNHTLAIHNAFPNVSINWLLFGEGDMYISSDSTPIETADHLNNEESSPSLFSSNESNGFTLSARPVQAFSPQESKQAYVPASELPKMVVPEVTKRQIKEIRVFYDDGTYETFSPS